MANVPAIIYKCYFVPFENELDIFRGMEESVVIFECRELCPRCGDVVPTLVVVWDFNFDRSCDFFIPYGEYCNARMIDEGTNAYLELQHNGGLVQ